MLAEPLKGQAISRGERSFLARRNSSFRPEARRRRAGAEKSVRICLLPSRILVFFLIYFHFLGVFSINICLVRYAVYTEKRVILIYLTG